MDTKIQCATCTTWKASMTRFITVVTLVLEVVHQYLL